MEKHLKSSLWSFSNNYSDLQKNENVNKNNTDKPCIVNTKKIKFVSRIFPISMLSNVTYMLPSNTNMIPKRTLDSSEIEENYPPNDFYNNKNDTLGNKYDSEYDKKDTLCNRNVTTGNRNVTKITLPSQQLYIVTNTIYSKDTEYPHTPKKEYKNMYKLDKVTETNSNLYMDTVTKYKYSQEVKNENSLEDENCRLANERTSVNNSVIKTCVKNRTSSERFSYYD